MEDEAELQAKIAAIAGQINLHKQQPQAHPARHNNPYSYYAPPPARAAPRWAPYGHFSGRGGRRDYAGVHRNRTLVLGGAQQNLDENNANTHTTLETASNNLIAARASNKHQLMTKEVYEREQRQKEAYQNQHALQRQQPMHQPRLLELDGIKFQMKDDGSKLTRIPDPDTDQKETPKKVKVADIDFVRTKHGNLIRAMSLQPNGRSTSAKQCERLTKYGTETTHPTSTGHNRAAMLRRPFCAVPGKPPYNMLTFHAGNCPLGPACRDKHDPYQIAICKEFFSKGTCLDGKNCDLSHEPTYNRVPACTYFLRGNCTNTACRYAHVDVPTSAALVCRPFATLGYCAKGTDCGHRHVFECPDYTNNGYCEAIGKKGCPLPHVRHVRTLRKPDNLRDSNDSDASSDEEEQTQHDDNDDSDLDTVVDDDSHGLSQQRDYIAFQ